MLAPGGVWASLPKAAVLAAAGLIASACGGGKSGGPDATLHGGDAGMPSFGGDAGLAFSFAGSGGAAGSPAATGEAGLALNIGGSGGRPSESGPVTKENLAARAAVAVCDNIASCCQTARLAYQASLCQQSLAIDYQATYRSYQGRAVTFDADAALRCLMQTATAASSCSFGGPSTIDDCNQLFLPTLAPGDTCKSSVECTPLGGSICDATVTPSVCKLVSVSTDPFAGQPRGTAGDPCFGSCRKNSTDTSCGSARSAQPGETICWSNDALYCTSNSLCSPTKAAGDACASDLQCGPLLYCDAWGTSPSNTCVAQSDSGPCTPTGIECSPTAYCDSSSAHCQTLKADGAPCTAYVECSSGRCSGHTHTCLTPLAALCKGELY